MFDPKLLELIRKSYPEQIAKDIVSVQPMPNIDLQALSQHPLWTSFIKRHMKNDDEVS